MKNGNKSNAKPGVARSEGLSLERPGPRIAQRKRWARYSALKHGILSNAVLEDRESKADYDRLLRGFLDYFQPEGAPEEITAEMLATLFWRYRRKLQADAAGTAGSNGPSQEGEAERDDLDELKNMPFQEERGLVAVSLLAGSTKGLLKALECTAELRQRIKSEGPDWERDRQAVESLYGIHNDQEERPNPWIAPYDEDVDGDESKRASLALLKKYQASGPFEHDATLESEQEPIALTGDATTDLVTALTKHIECLQFNLAGPVMGGIHSKCRQAGGSGGLLRQEMTDQSLRHEVTLGRAIDRALGQLQRLQRRRLGRPVPK